MSERLHHYRLTMTWTGNDGTGTSAYRAYRRNHILSAAGKADIQGSSDPAFRGDPSMLESGRIDGGVGFGVPSIVVFASLR